jgi:Ca2+-binding RTX toxin-like protein
MRKTILLLASTALAVFLASGVAWAVVTDPIYCTAGTSCQGTGGTDVIIGTPSRDVIIPYDGEDTVYAGGGNDEVRHSFGNDTIKGGPGNDTLRGGRGNDVIYGGADKDLIDCAYLKTRKGDTADTAHYTLGVDPVVDCKDRIEPDETADGDETDPTDPTYVPPPSS